MLGCRAASETYYSDNEILPTWSFQPTPLSDPDLLFLVPKKTAVLLAGLTILIYKIAFSFWVVSPKTLNFQYSFGRTSKLGGPHFKGAGGQPEFCVCTALIIVALWEMSTADHS